MNLRLDARWKLQPLMEASGHSDGTVLAVHPLAEGRAVIHLITREGIFGDPLHHLLVLEESGHRSLEMPSSLKERIAELEHLPAHQGVFVGPLTFQVHGKIGLLLLDRYVWLLDPDEAEPTVELEVEPLARRVNRHGSSPFRPCRCGLTLDGRVPVIFRHPDGRDEFTNYLSLLEIDSAARQARWSLRDDEGKPVYVRYRVNPNFDGGPEYGEYLGTILGDVICMGDRLRIFSLGNATHYGRTGMSYTTVLETKLDGSEPRVLREVDESCFGGFSSDGQRVVLTPLFKSGGRKGKPALLDLATGHETSIAVRGLAKHEPFSATASSIWLAGPSSRNGSWRSVSVDGKSGSDGEIARVCWG
jgi:hypothetical protein